VLFVDLHKIDAFFGIDRIKPPVIVWSTVDVRDGKKLVRSVVAIENCDIDPNSKVSHAILGVLRYGEIAINAAFRI